MGLIKEPKGVDLNVGPSVLTGEDRQFISAIINEYKKTCKLPSIKSSAQTGTKAKQINKK